MLRFFGEGENIIHVQGEYIGDAGTILANEGHYMVSDGQDAMLVKVWKDSTDLWGVGAVQWAKDTRIPWKTWLAMHETGDATVLEIDCPSTVEVKIV